MIKEKLNNVVFILIWLVLSGLLVVSVITSIRLNKLESKVEALLIWVDHYPPTIEKIETLEKLEMIHNEPDSASQ